jgi:probable F420-dependent oxidoreductase
MTQLAVMIAGTHRMLGPDLSNLTRFIRLAEDVGFDEFLLGDHVVMGSGLDTYPYGAFGYGKDLPPITPDEPWPEVLTVLAAAASVTERIRLAPGVLLAPLRPAALLAKMVATIDVLSHGRVSLGVGIGWQREEYTALGLDYRRAWGRLEDTIGACRALWSSSPATFASPTVSFTDIYCSPSPVQERIPVWFGGSCTPRMAARVAQLGDGWFPLVDDPETIAAGIKAIREEYAALGRDARQLSVRASIPLIGESAGRIDIAAAARRIPELLEAGVTSLWCAVTPGLGLTSLSQMESALSRLVVTLREAI